MLMILGLSLYSISLPFFLNKSNNAVDSESVQKILAISTRINNSHVFSETINVNYEIEQNITLVFNESISGNPIPGANGTYQWSFHSNQSMNGSGSLEDKGLGLYLLDFDTELRDIGTYDLIVILNRTGYDIGYASLKIVICKRNLNASVIYETSVVTQTQIAQTILNITDAIDHSIVNISKSNITWVENSIPASQVTYTNVTNGVFSLNVTTDNLLSDYDISISFMTNEYSNFTYEFDFNVSQFYVQAIINQTSFTIVENSGFYFSIELINPLNGSRISDAIVLLFINNRNIRIEPLGNGLYGRYISLLEEGMLISVYDIMHDYSGVLCVYYGDFSIESSPEIKVTVIHQTIFGIPLFYFLILVSLMIFAIGLVSYNILYPNLVKRKTSEDKKSRKD
ncbi:MAG: hypothetical protein ACTSSI_12930 [Candidatus Helarchaeota archaeon]